MKKYTSYKKIIEPYFSFSELLAFPILPIFLIAVVSYVILLFAGFTTMVVVNIIIAVVLSVLYDGLKKMSPNGSNNPTSISLIDFIVVALPSFLLVCGLMVVINSGVYIIVTFQQKGIFYKLYFYIWLFVMFALPALYYLTVQLKYQFELYCQAYYFTPLSFHIRHDCELLSGKIQVAFLQTNRKRITSISVPANQDEKQAGRLMSKSVAERNQHLFAPVYNEMIQIPDKTNRIRLSWYSVVEDAYYEDEIDFPFDKLVFVKNQYPLDVPAFRRGKKTDRVTLYIKQGGEIQLFNKHENLLDRMFIKPVEVSVEKKKEWTEGFGKKLPARIHAIKESHAIEKRAQLLDYIFDWQVAGTGLDGHHVEVKDVKNSYTSGGPITLNAFDKRRLPIFFDVDYRKKSWLYIHIDAEKLYNLILQHRGKEPAITFELHLNPEKGAANLIVKNGDQVLPFTAWENKLDEYRLKEVQDKFLEKKEQTIKNDFLKDIYECIVRKDYAVAEKLCKSALEKYPYFPMIYFYEARLLWYNNGFEASYTRQEYFLEKTKTDPYALAQIHNHYGCLYDEQKRYPEALVCFEKAYAIYPEMLYYLANIAEVHYKLKQDKEALHYAQECVKKECTSDMISEIIANKGVMKKDAFNID